MGSLLFGNRPKGNDRMNREWSCMVSGWAGLMCLVWSLSPAALWGASLPQRDLNEISRLAQDRGLSRDQVDRLIEQASRAGDRGLPPETILNKIKEGLAKGVPPGRVAPVLQDMVRKLETARDVLGDVVGRGNSREGGDQRSLEVLAEAFSRGVKPDEVRAIGRVSGKGKVNREGLAFGAKGLALTKEAGIAGADGLALVGEAVRQGFRPGEILELGREIKKRGREFREDHARLESIKKAVKRGDRPDKIFREEFRDKGSRGKDGEKALKDRERKDSRDRKDVKDKERERKKNNRERLREERKREDQERRRDDRDRVREDRKRDDRIERRDSRERDSHREFRQERRERDHSRPERHERGGRDD